MLNSKNKNDKSNSLKLQRSIIIYSALGIFFTATVVAMVSIIPLMNTLSVKQRNTLNFAVKTTVIALQDYVARSKDTATSITSRTKIRQKLMAYNNGELSYDDLYAFSSKALGDAMRGSEHVRGITRLDKNGALVVQVGMNIPDAYWVLPGPDVKGARVAGPISLDGDDVLLVSAPIIDSAQGWQGTDIVVFDLQPMARILEQHVPTAESADAILARSAGGKVIRLFSTNLNHEDVSIQMAASSAVGNALSHAFDGKEGWINIRDSHESDTRYDHVIAYAPIPDANLAMALKMDEAELNSATRRLGVEVASLIAVLIVIGTLGMVLVIRPLAGRVLMHTDELTQKIAKQTKELTKKEARLRAIVDNAADGVITVKKGGFIDLFNPAAERIFALTCSDIYGQRIRCLFNEQDIDDEARPTGEDSKLFGDIVCTGQVEVQGVRKDGTTFPAEVTAGDISLQDSYQRVYIVRDISERKRAEQELHNRLTELNKANETIDSAQAQLLQSEKMASIGQLAAGVAHEINNPVGYINSNVGTLKQYIDDLFVVLDGYQSLEDNGGNEELFIPMQKLKAEVELKYLREDVHDLIKESQEGVTRVKQIVQDLKDFSHVDEADWQWTDLQKGLDSTLNVVHNEIKYKADIDKKYCDMPRVECMPSQLNQVFMNLLVNAAHAIEDRGKITIQTRALDDQVCISITDTGKGINADITERIFEPFFTTKPVGKGTGLGLSLSYGIVEKHGGRIEVNSEVGQGTTFHVWIPIKQTDDAEHKPAESDAA